MQRENKKLYLISFLIFLSSAVFILNGCVDENIVPSEGNISAQMYDCNLFPGRIGWSTISIGPYPRILPDYNGIAKLTASSFPYDLRVTFDDKYHIPEYTVYDGVTNSNNCIMPTDNFETWEWKAVYLNLKYPVIPEGKKALIKFISSDPFGDNNWIGYEADEGTSWTNYYIYYPSIKNQITGKFLFIEFSFDNYYGQVTSFDNYGEKITDVSEFSKDTIIFTEDDIKTNPSDCLLYFDFKLPDKIHSSICKTYFSFNGYNSSSDLPVGYCHPGYEFIFPSNLPIDFKIKVYDEFLPDKNIISAKQEKWFYIEPCSNNLLDNSYQPPLISPPDKTNKINDNCLFSYGSEGNGIYYLVFSNDRYTTQKLVTSKNKITFGEIKNKGITFLPGSLYYWWVEQPSGFSSVDEYLSEPYILNPKYTSKICSNVRTFTTAP